MKKIMVTDQFVQTNYSEETYSNQTVIAVWCLVAGLPEQTTVKRKEDIHCVSCILHTSHFWSRKNGEMIRSEILSHQLEIDGFRMLKLFPSYEGIVGSVCWYDPVRVVYAWT